MLISAQHRIEHAHGKHRIPRREPTARHRACRRVPARQASTLVEAARRQAATVRWRCRICCPGRSTRARQASPTTRRGWPFPLHFAALSTMRFGGALRCEPARGPSRANPRPSRANPASYSLRSVYRIRGAEVSPRAERRRRPGARTTVHSLIETWDLILYYSTARKIVTSTSTKKNMLAARVVLTCCVFAAADNQLPITFANRQPFPVDLLWADGVNDPVLMSSIDAGEEISMNSSPVTSSCSRTRDPPSP